MDDYTNNGDDNDDEFDEMDEEFVYEMYYILDNDDVIKKLYNMIKLLTMVDFEMTFFYNFTAEQKNQFGSEIMEPMIWMLDEPKVLNTFLNDENIKYIIQPYLKKDLVENCNIIFVKDIPKIIAECCMFKYKKIMDEFVEKGIADLCWDAEKNDFIYKLKDNAMEQFSFNYKKPKQKRKKDNNNG